MKKGVKRWLAILALCCVATVVVGCSGGREKDSQSSSSTSGFNSSTGNSSSSVQNEDLLEISGVTFVDKSVIYDGQEKSIEIGGTVPAGVNVAYTNNKGTAAGSYEAKVVLSGEGYKTKILTATLTIQKATFTGIAFNNETFDYDGTPKKIEVVGVLPQGTTVKYQCQENTAITNETTETGVYTITATISNANYQTCTMTATLKIQGEEINRFIVANDDVIYFANALDKEYLYSYDGTEVSRVSMDVPYDFTEKNGTIYFRSKSLFGNSIKSIGENTVSTVASAKAEYLTSDGQYFYYAVNALTQGKSGIYKLDISTEEPTASRLTSGKAKYLQYNNGFLYFADGENGYKLTKISTSGGNKVLVKDVKISTLTIKNNHLFYTVNNTFGDYIENYNLSNGQSRKLTVDAGANLTVVGDKLYYVLIDKLTSYLKGSGIYMVDAYPNGDKNLMGTKLLGDDTYSSLVGVGGTKIAYYKVSNQMLCVYDLQTKELTNVLDGFKAEETIPLSVGSKTIAYNGILYYLDLYEDKVLMSYNPTNGEKRKMTSNKVSDFSIVNDYLYYNSVNFGVNNDLYRVNLKLGGEAEKVSSNDCVDITFADSKIYYVEQNAVGVRTAVHVIDENNTDSIMYSKGVNNLRYYNQYIYFVDGDTLHRMPTNSWTKDGTEVIRSKDVDVFEIDNGVIYFREVLILNKNLSKMNIDGTGYVVLIEKTYDPVEIIVQDNYVYFYSSTTKENTTGLYRVNKDGSNVEKIMEKKTDDTTYYVTSISIIGNEIYFINYGLSGTIGDSHLYKYSMTTKQIEKVA